MENKYQIQNGDCREVMRLMAANTIDSIVTDPPYGLSFMGKGWDHGVPGVDFWTEAIRVAKPGAHLMAFGGTRTFHRLACAIEDAGWEVRDCVMWVYGSGFPKSLDVSKAIDKTDAAQEQMRRRYEFTRWVRSTGITAKQINEATHTNMGGHYTTEASQPAIMTREHLEQCRPLIGEVPEWVEREADQRTVESENMKRREVVGTRVGVDTTKQAIACATSAQGLERSTKREFNITVPATDAARQWQGWGTALKPAWEPVIVARKPLVGTVAANVLEHGTGAINVDGCRVGTEEIKTCAKSKWSSFTSVGDARGFSGCAESTHTGRWPANLIHDGSEEATAPMRDAARFFYCAKASAKDRDEGVAGVAGVAGGMSGRRDGSMGSITMRKNTHPTVKPTALMRYLCKLVTQPGGLILDPFMGSGSTGKAAMLEGFRFIGIDLDPEYAKIAEARIRAVTEGRLI